MTRVQMVTRPDISHLPETPLPIYPRSVGNFDYPPNYQSPCLIKLGFIQIFWGIAGRARVTLGETDYEFGANRVLWKRPEESHQYHVSVDGLEFRWLTFDGPMAETFIQQYAYPRLIENAEPCPVHLFDEMERGLRLVNPYNQRRLIGVIAEILALAGGRSNDGDYQDRIVNRFIELAETHLSDATVNVNALAEMVGVHRSTLTRFFREKTRISPGDYLNRSRLRRALALLRETDLPIHEVARQSGMENHTCFSRAIKREVGVSPRDFRRGALARERKHP